MFVTTELCGTFWWLETEKLVFWLLDCSNWIMQHPLVTWNRKICDLVVRFTERNWWLEWTVHIKPHSRPWDLYVHVYIQSLNEIGKLSLVYFLELKCEVCMTLRHFSTLTHHEFNGQPTSPPCCTPPHCVKCIASPLLMVSIIYM